MTDKEIEALAKKGTPMPNNATLADTLFYQNLRLLYREYKSGAVGKEQGKILKSQLVKQYGVQKLWERCAQTDYERWRRYQLMQDKAVKNGCPICRKIVAVLDGRDKR